MHLDEASLKNPSPTNFLVYSFSAYDVYDFLDLDVDC
jgi:hypothetical protein